MPVVATTNTWTPEMLFFPLQVLLQLLELYSGKLRGTCVP